MGILSAFRQSLFRDSSPLNIIGKAPICPYKIADKIAYEKSKHYTIYDFVNDAIYQRKMDNFSFFGELEENKFVDKNGNEISFEFIQNYIETLSQKDTIMIEFAIPSANYVLAVFERKQFEPIANTNINLEDAIFYNVYHTFIQNQIYKKTLKEIAAIEYKKIPELNWLWFRKTGAFMNTKIIQRATSWIEQNPDFHFHLWTNLSSKEEEVEFFQYVDSKYLTLFMERVKIHYLEEVIAVSKEYCVETGVSEKDTNTYIEILKNNVDKTSMLMKTDVFRCMLLYLRGGWYADFNDTYCFTHLKYVVLPECDKIYVCTDSVNLYNNYIMYAPQRNRFWLDVTKKIFKNGLEIYKIIKCNDEPMYNFVMDSIREFITAIDTGTAPSIIERTIHVLDKMQKRYNQEAKELFERQGIMLEELFSLNLNQIILFVRYLMEGLKSSSILYRKLALELYCLRSLNRGRGGRYRISFKQIELENLHDPSFGCMTSLSHLYNKSLFDVMEEFKDEYNEDMTFWKSLPNVEKRVIYNLLIPCNINSLIYTTNFGSFFHERMDKDKLAKRYIYSIPYCYLLLKTCFITALGHIGDGTCTGQVDGRYASNLV